MILLPNLAQLLPLLAVRTVLSQVWVYRKIGTHASQRSLPISCISLTRTGSNTHPLPTSVAKRMQDSLGQALLTCQLLVREEASIIRTLS